MTNDPTRCQSADHEQHLCWMATQTTTLADATDRPSMEEQQALMRDPRFRCDWCGRVAAHARNLCKPLPLGENENCAHAGHERHLCHLVAQALFRQEALAYCGGWPIPSGREDLVRAPRFRCQTCGRLARNDENLCAPMELRSL